MPSQCCTIPKYTRNLVAVGDGNFDIYSGLDRNGGNLGQNFAGAQQVDQTLVDAHLNTEIK